MLHNRQWGKNYSRNGKEILIRKGKIMLNDQEQIAFDRILASEKLSKDRHKRDEQIAHEIRMKNPDAMVEYCLSKYRG